MGVEAVVVVAAVVIVLDTARWTRGGSGSSSRHYDARLGGFKGLSSNSSSRKYTKAGADDRNPPVRIAVLIQAKNNTEPTQHTQTKTAKNGEGKTPVAQTVQQ